MIAILYLKHTPTLKKIFGVDIFRDSDTVTTEDRTVSHSSASECELGRARKNASSPVCKNVKANYSGGEKKKVTCNTSDSSEIPLSKVDCSPRQEVH